MNKIDSWVYWACGLFLGFIIGHVQQYNWTIQREVIMANAFIEQIQHQDCDDGFIWPPETEVVKYERKKEEN